MVCLGLLFRPCDWVASPFTPPHSHSHGSQERRRLPCLKQSRQAADSRRRGRTTTFACAQFLPLPVHARERIDFWPFPLLLPDIFFLFHKIVSSVSLVGTRGNRKPVKRFVFVPYLGVRCLFLCVCWWGRSVSQSVNQRWFCSVRKLQLLFYGLFDCCYRMK